MSLPSGVDLSECLQYPDFSVVVLYKKVIIAFGFMVPDVKYNEAYISFLFVHPEWRRAGIATFMIYHLIQVCGRGLPERRDEAEPRGRGHRVWGGWSVSLVEELLTPRQKPSSLEKQVTPQTQVSKKSVCEHVQ